MLKKSWYVSNKLNLEKVEAEGYERCPFCKWDEVGDYKYIVLKEDNYYIFSDFKG